MHHYFSLLDYFIFGAVLLISACIGVYYRFTGGRQKTFKEYLLADQSMSLVPVAFSLMASFMSAITLLGVSRENYMYGTQFILINISYILSTPICCYLYLPVFFRLKKISVYEYLECRFGRATRLGASLAFILQMTLYMGIALFAPALALSAVTGLSQTWSILSVGAICTFYSTIGGMKAVLITDVFQSLLMFAAIFAVIIQGVIDYGVFDIFSTAYEGKRLEFFNLSLDPRERHTVWNLGIGGVVTYCSLYGVNQAQVQRLLSVKSLSKARQSLWLQCIIVMALSLSTSFSGLVLYRHYKDCDPISSKQISSSDQIMPLYVVEKLGSKPGVAGLFVAGIFSGSLSTLSSSLNSLSAVVLQDFILPWMPLIDIYGEERTSTLGKLLAFAFGILCISIAFLVQLLGTGILQASLTIFGAVGGPLMALFTLGMLYRSANQKGALVGLLCGLVMTLWIGFGTPKNPIISKPLSTDECLNWNITVGASRNETSLVKLDVSVDDFNNTIPSLDQDRNETIATKNLLQDFYSISYMWVGMIGFLTTLFIGIVFSHATGGPTKPLDPIFLSSWVWKKTEQQAIQSNEAVQLKKISPIEIRNAESLPMDRNDDS